MVGQNVLIWQKYKINRGLMRGQKHNLANFLHQHLFLLYPFPYKVDPTSFGLIFIQMKATEQYIPMVLFIILYKMVLTFKSWDEILKCNQSNESYSAILSCGAVYYIVQGGSNFWVCRWNPAVWPFKQKLLSSSFFWCCLLWCTRWF